MSFLSPMRKLVFRAMPLVLLMVYAGPGTCDNAPAPRLAAEYLNVLTTYACHAKTLWHDASPGGYWGDGLDAKNQNGAVRGTCNTLLTYAMLLHATRNDWLAKHDRQALKAAGLTREVLLKYIRDNVAYLVAHHRTAPGNPQPRWGHNWQSSLWVGALAPAALLTWSDLGPDLQTGLQRVVADEADWVGSKPPKDMHPGDTGAEENGWNTAAPAAALALYPEATSATLWWTTLKVFSVNTYSRKADRASTETIGEDRLSDIVSTANVSDDLSMINHGFFHPDYAQVSGQHLGEAWTILKMGDLLHGAKLAERYVPYARHNVEAVWRAVMRPLLLPSGEFLFPSGNDWTYHCSTNQSYFAFMASFFNDADAAAAEERGLDHVRNRRDASPPGRLLGDSNLEWWWEPLVSKRCTTALLMHMLNGTRASFDPSPLDSEYTSVTLADARAAIHRTPRYIVSASWGKPRMLHFVPFSADRSQPYLTVPQKNALLPKNMCQNPLEMSWERLGETPEGIELAAMVLTPVSTDKAETCPLTAVSVVCLPNSVVIAGSDDLQSLWLENDSLTEPGRLISSTSGETKVPALKPSAEFPVSPKWLNADNALTLIGTQGFHYQPAGRWNFKSVAADQITPAHGTRILQLAGGTAGQALQASLAWREAPEDDAVAVTVADGGGGRKYKLLFQKGVVQSAEVLGETTPNQP